MGLVTLISDLLTLKLVCESTQRWGTLNPNLGTLGLRILHLFAVRDGRTGGQNQLLLPLSYSSYADIIISVYLCICVDNGYCLYGTHHRLQRLIVEVLNVLKTY